MNTREEERAIFRLLWAKKWRILPVALLLAALFFCAAHWLIPPRYEARLLFYVKLGEDVTGDSLYAARELADSYALLIGSDRVLDAVAAASGLPLTARELSDQVFAEALNGTELLEVRFRAPSAGEAVRLADAAAACLPEACAEIVPAGTLRLVDGAETAEKIFPSELKFTLFGLALGLLLAVTVILARRLRKNYVNQNM